MNSDSHGEVDTEPGGRAAAETRSPPAGGPGRRQAPTRMVTAGDGISNLFNL